MNKQLAIEIATALIKRFEGCILHPYLCPAGVPTIGYGATYYEDGTIVTLRDEPITQERAQALLIWMIETVYLPAVQRLCPHIDDAFRLAAIIDFTYNLGSGALRISTLRKRINADRWEAVPHELMKWVHAAGRILRGLQLRRKSECRLI